MSCKSLAAIAIWLPFATSSSVAGTLVHQQVVTDVDGQKSTAEHHWEIEDKGFRLEVNAGKITTSYLFNGRNFYICSPLQEQQLKVLEQLGVSRDEVNSVYANRSICQDVPANFMTRFFLHPTAAVGSVDLSDGMRITMTIADYTLKEAASKETSAACKSMERSFVIDKLGLTAEAEAAISRQFKSSQQICVSTTVDWRQSFYREIQKSVLRQPKSGDLLRLLQEDVKGLPGLILSGTETFDVKLADGTSRRGTRSWQTISVKDQPISAEAFKLPKNYSLFSPREFFAKTVKKETAKTKEEAGPLERLPAVFFCALSGPLGCLLQ